MNRATNRSCIFIVLLLLCVTQQITSKRTFGGGGSRHSYPSSGGLSGSGSRHSYPSSGGLSGTGGSHGYPSGGSHGYPSSGGLSGTGHSRPSGNAYPSNTQSHGYPSNTQSHGYPSNKQSHGYPSSTGMSGNSRPSGGHTTNVHYHYNYNPPQQIRYTPVHGGAPINYPVYHGTPPTYVYKYQDSGSRYGTLLAGLALLNLGTLAGTAYALNKGHSNSYKPAPGEVCKFGLKKENGDYEETRIDCEIISSFIYMELAKANNVSNTNTVVTTTVTNVTTINSPHNETAPAAAGPVLYEMYPNGTLVPRNETTNNTTTAANNTDNTMASSVTVTTTNTTTVTNALDVKGKPVDVTPVIISACWAAGAVVGLLPLFGWHAAVDDSPGCYFVEVMDYNYLLFLYFATIVTPSVLLAGFYAHIYRVVIKQMSAVVTVEGGQGREGTMLRVLGAAQKREVKATQNLAIIVFFFIICWIPLYTINAVKAFMPTLDIPNTLTYFCIIFSHLNSAINPLLYAYHLKDFRAALKGLICLILGRGVPIPAAYRPPVPIRRPALERCNALRERPKIYVDSPVWRRQKEAEVNTEERSTGAAPGHDCEPFLNAARDSSSGRYTPEAHEGSNGPYLIEANLPCHSPYKKVEEFIRRVRSVSAEPS